MLSAMSSSTTKNVLNATRRFFPFNPPRNRNPKSVSLVRFKRAKTWDKFSFCTSSSPTSKPKFVVRSASSSAPLGGEYSEQFVVEKPKQDRKKRIAGIDQDEVEDPRLLADADSCFCKFDGVEIHHKICEPDPSPSHASSLQERTEKTTFPMILLHGFGASVFSWDRAMKSLARIVGSKVLSFDRPAFGLTSRSIASERGPKSPNPFSFMFSVLATLYFIDFLAAEKAILVGHSAGATLAVDTYFEAPERVAALILVAPAIFAPLIAKDNVKEKRGEVNNSPFAKVLSVLSNFTKLIAGAIFRVLRGMTDMINALYKKALSAILRSAAGLLVIRKIIDQFGVNAVRSSWYDPSQVSDDVIEGYTKPLKVKGWDKALAEYVVAMLTDSSTSEIKKSVSERLGEISCPVLIIAGDTDRLVPSWNSVRLSKAIPGSYLKIIEQCGHLPHEEKTQEFVAAVDEFVKGVFSSAQEQEPHLQAVN